MLVTQESVEARLRRSLTEDEEAQFPYLVADVESFITSYTERAFTVADRTKILRAERGIIHLPDRPIVSVTSVKQIQRDGTPGPATQDFAFDGIFKLRIGSSSYVINGPEWWWDGESGSTFQTYQVVYRSGYATPPADIVSIAQNLVTNALVGSVAVAPGMSGVSRMAIGDVAYTFAGGGIGRIEAYLSDDDRKILNKYRGLAHTSMYEA